MSALVQIVLNRFRREQQRAEEAAEAYLEGNTDSAIGIKDPEKLRKGDMLMERVLSDTRELEVIKARMVERLVLEASMETGLLRCVLFFIGFTRSGRCANR